MNNDEIEIEQVESEIEDEEKDTAEYKINTYGADYTLQLLSSMITDGEIRVPEFQRKYVWPVKKASKLIESFLLGLPVPQIFLYREAETQDLLVVDGQQRLLSASYFINGTLEDGSPFKLRGVKARWEGKSYSELEESEKRKIRNYILRATIFEQIDPSDHTSVFEIFERLNTGGMALNQQEIRNCVIRGNIKAALNELNNDPAWRELLNKTHPDKRMKDVEMILRFFSLLDGWNNYKGPMKDFMGTYMRAHKNITDEQKNKMAEIFSKTMSCILNKAGTNVFKLKGGINLALFDSISIGVALTGCEKINDLSKKIEELKQNPTYLDYVSKATTNEDSVKGRIKIVYALFLQNQ